VANTLLEAIMKGLAQAAGGVGQQIQQRDLLNTERQDQWRRLMGDRAWQQKVFEANQQNRKEDRLQDYMYRTAANLDAGAESAARKKHEESTLAETIRHNRAMEGVGYTREDRLGKPQSDSPKAHPAGRAAVTAWRATRKVPNPLSQSGALMEAPQTPASLDTLNTLMMTGQFPMSKQPTEERLLGRFSDPRMSAVYGLNKPEAKQGYGPDGSFPTLEEYEEAKRMGIVQ
jgi:hypothetical protein